MSGVKKVNALETVTVTVLPAPAPPVAAEHAIVVPTWSAQTVVTVKVPSPACPCTLLSALIRALMAAASVGMLAAMFAPSRAALNIWTYVMNTRPKSRAINPSNSSTGRTNTNSGSD